VCVLFFVAGYPMGALLASRIWLSKWLSAAASFTAGIEEGVLETLYAIRMRERFEEKNKFDEDK
jgi:hypothetical protein